GVALVFCDCELARRRPRERASLRRTRVRIEYAILARPASRPGNSHLEAKSSKTYVVASRCGHLLYGVGRHLRHRRHRARRWLWARHSDFAVHSGSLELADRVHDRRVVQRATLGGRLLRMGAARPW